MNINLGEPYEAIMKRIIQRGYAGNQTEVIRQALMMYERSIEEEEVVLVNKGIEYEMQEIRSGRVKVKGFDEVKKSLGL